MPTYPTNPGPKYRHYLKEWRLYRGMRQQDLAQRVGSSNGMISRYESGTRAMTLEVQFRLMAALDISPWEFFLPPQEDAMQTKLRAIVRTFAPTEE